MTSPTERATRERVAAYIRARAPMRGLDSIIHTVRSSNGTATLAVPDIEALVHQLRENDAEWCWGGTGAGSEPHSCGWDRPHPGHVMEQRLDRVLADPVWTEATEAENREGWGK